MDLSMKDRILLANQCLILEKLYPDEAKHYQVQYEALRQGYKYHYDDFAEHFHQDMEEELSEEIIGIFNMFSAITFSVQKLEDKTGIDERKIQFRGFEGNNESQCLGYTRYYIVDLGRFNELRYGIENPDYNSHMPMLDTYRRMFSKWKSLPRQHDLSAEQIKKITT